MCASYIKQLHWNPSEIDLDCQEVSEGSVVRAADITIRLSDKDKSEGKGEDWYLTRITPYFLNVAITLINVRTLEGMFGVEWRTLGIGKGIQRLQQLTMFLPDSMPRLDGLFNQSWSELTFLYIKSWRNEKDVTEVGWTNDLGRIQVDSMNLYYCLINVPWRQ